MGRLVDRAGADLLPALSGPLLVGGPPKPRSDRHPARARGTVSARPRAAAAARTGGGDALSQAGFIAGTSAVLGPPLAVTALHSSIP